MNITWLKLCTIVILSCVIGAGVVWFAMTNNTAEESYADQNLFNNQFFDRFYDDNFFGQSRNPFQEIERMRKEMQKEFEAMSGNQNPWFGNKFDHWFKGQFGDSPANSIKMSEDDDYIYYKLDISGFSTENITVNVADSMVEIIADLHSKSERKNGNSGYSSTQHQQIHQKFPVPPGSDPNSLKVETQDETVVIRFNKIL